MDPLTISALLAVGSGALSIIGNISSARSDRRKARTQEERYETQQEWQKEQMDWQKEQMDWQIEDLEKQRERNMGSLLTQSSAMGVGGPSVDTAVQTTLGEFNRAISQINTQKSQIETQKDWMSTEKSWMQEDTDTFIDESYVNQWLGVGGSLLNTGANVYGIGAQPGGWWGPLNKKPTPDYKSLYGTGGSLELSHR